MCARAKGQQLRLNNVPGSRDRQTSVLMCLEEEELCFFFGQGMKLAVCWGLQRWFTVPFVITMLKYSLRQIHPV